MSLIASDLKPAYTTKVITKPYLVGYCFRSSMKKKNATVHVVHFLDSLLTMQFVHKKIHQSLMD